MNNIKLQIRNFNKSITSLLNLVFLKIKNFNKSITSLINIAFIKKNKNKTKKIKFIISNFNKYLIALITLLFLYVFYLSIPSLYNKGRLQKDLTTKLLDEFKINLSISSEIKYSILPSPHILVKNSKIYNNDLKDPKELGQIKKLKIFINQKKLYNQKDLEIRKILMTEANFLVQKNDFGFFNNFINKKFSKKNINIKKSNIFYKDKNNETIFILLLSNFNLFYDEKKLINQIITNGEVFQIPFEFKWEKLFNKKMKSTTSFKLIKLMFFMKNVSSINDNKYSFRNNLTIGNSKIISDYEIKDNKINFVSKDATLINNKINYNGEIHLVPFDLKLDIELEKIDINKFILKNFIFQEFLKSDLLFHKNLSGNISLTSKNVVKNKLFNSLKLLLNFDNGKISSNNSYLISNKIGTLDLYESKILREDGDLIFRGNFNFNIKNQDNFYRSFLVLKDNRKSIKNIYLDIEYSFLSNKFKIINFKLNNPHAITSDAIHRILNNHNNNVGILKNWIDIKSFTNLLFENYDG